MGFVLLRGGSGPAADFAAQLAEQASAVLQVRPDRGDEIAGEVLGELDRAAELLVALGGGRVIDVATVF